jgi:beta-hydroxyacyl-ACP dehydratase FabZ
MNATPLESDLENPDLPGAPLDFAGILATLPHRFPFLYVDKVESWIPKKSIRAAKNVSFNDPFFQGHFPSEPVMPGVIQIEALAQACCLLMVLSYPEEGKGKRPAFAGIEECRFRLPVRPGDVLVLEAEFEKFRRGFATFTTRAKVGGQVASEARIIATLV